MHRYFSRPKATGIPHKGKSEEEDVSVTLRAKSEIDLAITRNIEQRDHIKAQLFSYLGSLHGLARHDESASAGEVIMRPEEVRLLF